jgi:hypothetical protein
MIIFRFTRMVTAASGSSDQFGGNTTKPLTFLRYRNKLARDAGALA